MKKPEIILALLTMTLVSCMGNRRITEGGLRIAGLGMEMIPAGMMRYKGHVMRDSLCSENDFQWRVAILQYRKGEVWVEEDFFGGNIVNRLRITTPELRLRNGVRTGEKVERLQAIGGPWYINPMPAYQMFDFYSPLMPGIHFVVDEPGHPFDLPGWESYPISSFSPESRIVAIVVY